jgi:AcrR family transcriptional regulator
MRRGRLDKRQAVMAAAFSVFARDGYDQARVEDIAAAAGVAKATVYNHFGDKETLFRQAITDLSDAALTNNLRVIGLLDEAREDIAAALRRVGLGLAECYCADSSRALRRLLSSEPEQFSDLLGVVYDRVSRQVTRTLGDKLARLALAGRIRVDDPQLAAEQFTALLSGPIESRSRFGTRTIPRTELRGIARDAVSTFVKAFPTT